MACPRCGAANPPGASACAQCGTPLPDPAASTATLPAAKPATVVTVPGWVTRDWTLPVALAFVAAAIGIILAYAVDLFIVVGTLISSGGDADWGSLAVQPLIVWAGFHGAIKGFAVLVTGLVWIGIAFSMARTVLSTRLNLLPEGGPADRVTIGTRALKTGFVYMALVIVVSAVVTGVADTAGDAGLVFGGAGIGFAAGLGTVNVAGAIFAGFTLGAIAALVTLTQAARMPFATLLGLRSRPSRPEWWEAAVAGGRRTCSSGSWGWRCSPTRRC